MTAALTDRADQPAAILAMLKDTRAIHERLVSNAIQSDMVAGTCFYGAILVRETLNKFSAWECVVRGGAGESGEGFRDSAGQWHGHYWVEAVDPEGGAWVLDITSDQFDGPPVYMESLDAASCYRAGDQAEIEEHLREFGI